jgi:hypothetical protein
MATNTNTGGFGLRAAMTVGNTPATSGQSEYPVQTAPGVALFKGNPGSLQDAGNTGFLQDASFATTDDGGNGGSAYVSADANLLGVINGFFYIDGNSNPTFANSVAAGQTTSVDYNTGSNNITGFVIDNPQQEYVVRTDAQIGNSAANVQAAMGLDYNIKSFTATDAKSGMSTALLEVGAAGANDMFTMVRVAGTPNQSDGQAAGCDVVVTINPAAAQYN